MSRARPRLAIAGISHETNTFSSLRTGMDDFRVRRGPEILDDGLYQSFPDIRGITHTHSAYAVAWSQSLLPVPIFGTTHADHLAQDIPCTEVMSDEMIDGDYEEQTGKQIIDTFKSLSYKEVEMVLVACHGPFTWGNSAEKSLYNSAVLEEIAKMALLTKQINPQTAPLKKALRNKHYQRKHGKNAYYGQN